MRSTVAATALLIAIAIAGAAAGVMPAGARSWQAVSYDQSQTAVPVSRMTSPQSVRGRLVVDSYGRPMGRVISVDVDRDGKAQVVNIEVGGLLNLGTRVMPFAADRIVYYPVKAQLVASNEPSGIRPPETDPRSPTRASVKRPAPEPTIIRR